MKKILLLAIALLTITPALIAKDKDKDEEVKIVLTKDESSGEYIYEDVITVENVAKEEMFKRAKQWILSNLKTSDNNIQFDEKELSIINDANLIIKQGGGYSSFIASGITNLKVTLFFKDGRYKIRFDNVIVHIERGNGYPTVITPYTSLMAERNSKGKTHVINETNIQLGAIISKLEAAIKNSDNATKKNDW